MFKKSYGFIYLTPMVILVAVLCGIHARVAPDGQRELYVNPALPEWLPELKITHLRAGRGAVDLHFRDGEVEEGWLVLFDLRSKLPWAERLTRRTVEVGAHRIHVVDC